MNKRIKSYDDAMSVIESLKKQDEQRSSARAKVEQQISGNLPHDPEKLKALGQGYRSNINFMELDGNTKARLSSFLRLMFDTPLIAKITVEDTEIPINDRIHYGEIISQEFTTCIKRKWRGFFMQLARGMRNMVVHGLGPVYWPNKRSFKFKAASPGGIRFSHIDRKSVV
mgnify:FL=1